MRALVGLVGITLLLLCGLFCRPAAADDAQVRYVITNGGIDVKDNGGLHYYHPGDHDNVVAGAGSGTSITLPAGTYDVQVTFNDGDAHKELWINSQSFSGTVDRTVEVALPVAQVRYVITNNGADIQDKGQVHYYRPGKHDDVVSGSASGASVRIPAGTYDVQVTFNDGDAHKEIWIDNQSFSGTVEKTVEVGVALTDVRYVITNNGVDTGDKGQVHYYRSGKHDDVVTWSGSGGTVRMPAGTYDVQVTFTDGDAHKEQWIENQAFAGKVDRTAEVGVAVAGVRYVVTNGGADVGDKGQVHFYHAGKRDTVVTWFASGGTARLPAGAYDAQVTFAEGLARKDIWLNNQTYSGKVDKTVEVGITLAHPTVTVMQTGADAGSAALVRYFRPGSDDSLGEVANDTATVVEAGSYDLRGYVGPAEGWLRNTAITGTPHLTIAIQPPKTQVMVTAMRGGNPLAGAWCGLYALGKTDAAPLGRADSGAWQDTAPGTYDVGCTIVADGNTEHGWLRNQVLAVGRTELAIDLPAQCVVPAAFVLAAPAATPEKITPDSGDFPYLMPVPGSHAAGSRGDASPVYVQLPDAHQPELVANGSIVKTYQAPKCISTAALLGLYRDALPKAGWSLVSDVRQGNAALTAHYGQNKRNIWASVRANDGDYALAVADATVTPTTLAADLSARCHLALTGVLFDFDKSTLKPESDAVLTQVGLMMADAPSLRLDVQGHTDNVGSDAYNQRLSEARAASVVAWLTRHQVAADRLTAHGFGKTRPIASNDTDEGRARNRRVEIANPSCTRN